MHTVLVVVTHIILPFHLLLRLFSYAKLIFPELTLFVLNVSLRVHYYIIELVCVLVHHRPVIREVQFVRLVCILVIRAFQPELCTASHFICIILLLFILEIRSVRNLVKSHTSSDIDSSIGLC